MKHYKVLFTLFLMMFTPVLFAQVKKESNPGPYSTITKGYYSIGNNSERVHPPTIIAPDTMISEAPVKGYYSIGTNKQKPVKKAGWLQNNRKRPVITKGYYSIGNNADKLYGKSVE